jgi:hypothetical protein
MWLFRNILQLSEPAEQVRQRPLPLASTKLFHHALHLTELGKELIYFLYACAASSRDTSLTAGVENLGTAPLGDRHRIDDRLDSSKLLIG